MTGLLRSRSSFCRAISFWIAISASISNLLTVSLLSWITVKAERHSVVGLAVRFSERGCVARRRCRSIAHAVLFALVPVDHHARILRACAHDGATNRLGTRVI